MKAVTFIASWLNVALQVLQIYNRFISKQAAMVTLTATLEKQNKKQRNMI